MSRFLVLSGITIFVTFSFIRPLAAQTPDPSSLVDAAAYVQSLIAAKGDVPLTHQVYTYVTRLECTPLMHPGNPFSGPVTHDPDHMLCGPVRIAIPSNKTDGVIPTATNIRILSASQPVLDALVKTEFPDKIQVSSEEFVNCSSSTSQQSISLQTSFQKSASAALSHSLTNTQQFSISVSSGSLVGVGGPSVTASYSIGSSQTTGTVDTSGTSMTTTRSTTMTATITKGQAVVAEIEVWPVTMSQNFHTDVVLEADLSQNDRYAHLSDLYPDPASRTIRISGTFAITDASTGLSKQFDDPAMANSCSQPNQSVRQIPYSPSATPLVLLKSGVLNPN